MQNIPLIDRHSSPLPQSQAAQSKLLTFLDIDNFKINPCTIKVQHNHKQCQFFHYPKDRKRIGNYSPDLCPYVENEEMCPFGDNCMKSHSRVEQLYSPLKYKTRFCSYYPNNLQNCEYGDFCSFAHNEGEITIPLIHYYEFDDDFFLFHYKTVMCPFNQNKHDKSTCVYAHNWQDFRRRPNEFCYDPIPCPNWKTADFITNYDEACINGMACNKCHGWKEFDYHPLNYMMKPCPKGKNCNKKRDCTFFHNPNEKREISQNVQFKIFKFVPRNRVSKSPRRSLGEQNTMASFFSTNNNDVSGASLSLTKESPNTSMIGSWPKVYNNNNFNNVNAAHKNGTSTNNTFCLLNSNFLNNNAADFDQNNNNYYENMINLSKNMCYSGFMMTSSLNNGNSNSINSMSNSGLNINTEGVIGPKKVSWSNFPKNGNDFYPNNNNTNDNSNISYPVKTDGWKIPGFLPELIEEKENDENITPRSFKVDYQPSSQPFIDTSDNYSSNFNNLPPPYTLNKRDMPERSRFVGSFDKRDETPKQEENKKKYDDEMLKALNEIEKFSLKKDRNCKK